MSFWDKFRGKARPEGRGAPERCYAMSMQSDGSAEITMYGEVVKTHPTHWWTGKLLEGDYIAQDDFLRDLEKIGRASCRERV